MGKTFTEKLDAIIQKLAIEYRVQAEQDMKILKKAKVNSLHDCIVIGQKTDSNDKLRRIACWVLGNLGAKTATDALLQAFGDSSIDLCREAANALSKIKSKKSVQPLVSFLLKSQEPWRREAAAYSLGFIRDNRAVIPLVRVLRNNQEVAAVRSQAAEALAYLKDRKAVKPLLNALQDKTTEVRFWSVFALGEIGDRRAIPELKRLMKSDTSILKGWWSVRREAKEAIEKIRQ